MNKIFNYFKTEKFQQEVYPEIKRLVAVIVFTTIYAIGVVWFLEASVIPMYTGGIPGIAQLVRDFLVHILNVDSIVAWDGLFLGLFVFIFNIPILIIGWFGVSKKFTIYSLISVLIQSTVLVYIPKLDIGLSSLEHALTTSILAGLLIGIGTGGALKAGTSTGGLDILAQYFSFKKGKSVGFFSMAMNVSIAILGGLITHGHEVIENGNPYMVVGGVVASYTILRIVISTIVTDRIHTAYQFISVDILTETPDAIIDNILIKLHRGVTLFNVKGAYTKREKTSIMVIISSYELSQLAHMVQLADPRAFIIVRPVKQVIGNFKKKRIA